MRQEIVGLTVHLPFVGKDDFASTAWRVYRESFLKALFDIRRPYAFRVRCRQVLLVLENDLIQSNSVCLKAVRDHDAPQLRALNFL